MMFYKINNLTFHQAIEDKLDHSRSLFTKNLRYIVIMVLLKSITDELLTLLPSDNNVFFEHMAFKATTY